LIAEYANAAILIRIGTCSKPLEGRCAGADTYRVRVRVSAEEGFGLIELVFAMLVLNIGIFALIASFQSGTLAVSRSAAASNGTAVADKVMEAYRDLQNCAIYLKSAGTGTDSVTTGLPDGIPKSTSAWYSTYHGDTSAYASNVAGVAQTGYFVYPSGATSPQWVTENTAATGNVKAYCPSGFPGSGGAVSTFAASSGIDPTQAVQKVTGPDGTSYPVLSYIVLLQTSGTLNGVAWTGGYVKQVTVKVMNPRATTQVLARESSIFDPNTSP
jgi:type II secretory pathway pseudopilin PulG